MTADGDRFARINRGLEGKLACPQIGRGSGCYGGTKVRSVVPSGCWFGARPAEDSSYSFVGCTVAAGLILRILSWWTRRICAAVFLHQKREYAGSSRRLSIEQAPWEYPLQASDLFRRLAC
jgi:hypothetical protein